MNHRTRLDWMYFFTFLYHLQVLNRQKITLKSAIKWAPVIGEILKLFFLSKLSITLRLL